MKYTAAIVLASAAAVSADCSVASFEENGNWFCQAVSLIKYEGLDTTGTYSAVSAMNSDGSCDFEDKAYSGSIAPYDEELSVHIRGPAQLKQFAVYTAGSSSSTKKRQEHKSHHKRHGHQHLHKKHAESKQEAARALGDIVTAVIDGKTVSWTNTYSGETAAVNAAAAVETSSSKTTTSAKSSKTSTASTTSTSVASGDYTRVAYYNAEDATADGITFLGTYGGSGSGSGVWDTTFGNSLSYLSADGTSGAESSTVLDNVLVGDNIEYIITSDTECTSDDADCGFYREGTVAYQGFGGADKVFLFEFTMPLTGNTDWNCDMPAIWLLNAKIPRTQQYGDCSCWGSNGRGCGEADLFEVLATGDTKAKSTFHFLNALGSSDYFDRPTSDYIKLAAVFRSSDSTVSIKVLDSSVDFSSSLTADTVDSFIVEDSSSLLSTIESFLSSL